jgi:hypothetical protein
MKGTVGLSLREPVKSAVFYLGRGAAPRSCRHPEPQQPITEAFQEAPGTYPSFSIPDETPAAPLLRNYRNGWYASSCFCHRLTDRARVRSRA